MNRFLVGRGVLASLGVCAALAGTSPSQATVRNEAGSQAPLTSTPESSADVGLLAQSYPLTSVSGDVADLISLQAGGAPVSSPQDLAGNFDLQAILIPDILLAQLLLEASGIYGTIVPRGTDGSLVGAFLNSDSTPFCIGDTCFIAGRVEVPEPISMTLLGVGLFGVAAARARRSAFPANPESRDPSIMR